MALAVGTDVTAAARALLTDVAGEVYDNTVLLPFLQRAYRYSARYLRAKGVGILRKQSSVIAMTIGQNTLTRPGGNAPNYPADLLRPLQLRERQTGGGGLFTIIKMSDGFLPDKPAKEAFELYDWRDDKILLQPNGATQNRDIQIQYEADLTAITAVSDTLLIPDCLDALAAITASFAAATRDEQTNSEKLRQIGERDLDLIAASELLVRKAQGAQWQA